MRFTINLRDARKFTASKAKQLCFDDTSFEAIHFDNFSVVRLRDTHAIWYLKA